MVLPGSAENQFVMALLISPITSIQHLLEPIPECHKREAKEEAEGGFYKRLFKRPNHIFGCFSSSIHCPPSPLPLVIYKKDRGPSKLYQPPKGVGGGLVNADIC